MKVGLLALQGAFREHGEVLASLGVETVEVRLPQDLDSCAGLIMPGGESTAISKLMDLAELREPIKSAHRGGMAIFGTCAGAILLAREIENAASGQVPLDLMDMCIRRNGYGRQINSFETMLPFSGTERGEVAGVFIRAPRFDTLGKGVEVLSVFEDEPVAVRQGNLLATAFHPELTADTSVHRYFIEQVIGS